MHSSRRFPAPVDRYSNEPARARARCSQVLSRLAGLWRAQAERADAESMAEVADELMELGEHDLAQAVWLKILPDCPEPAFVWSRVAVCRFLAGQLDSARLASVTSLRLYREELDEEGFMSELCALIGIHYAQEDFEGARSLLEEMRHELWLSESSLKQISDAISSLNRLAGVLAGQPLWN